jgi:hypothetical protein
LRRRVIYKRDRRLGALPGIAGSFLTPVIDAVGVGRSAEIVASLIGPSPSALACGLAGLLAVGLGAVSLMVAAAWVRIVQLAAAAALMFSATARHVSRCRTGRPLGKPAGSIEEDQEKKIGKEKEEECCAGTGEENPREEATSDRPNQSTFSLAAAPAAAARGLARSRSWSRACSSASPPRRGRGKLLSPVFPVWRANRPQSRRHH